MRRWDGLVEQYAKLNETKGLAVATIDQRTRELERFGSWLKRRRPKPRLEDVDSELIVGYVRDRTCFHKRGTVCGVVSILRGMGEFLVAEGFWQTNPLRWIRGPKLDPRCRQPRRIDRKALEGIWDAARKKTEEHGRYQSVGVLAVLYGVGLRNGELERLDIGDWDEQTSVLNIDGRKTGCPRHIPVGEAVWRCIEAYLPKKRLGQGAQSHPGNAGLCLAERSQRPQRTGWVQPE